MCNKNNFVYVWQNVFAFCLRKKYKHVFSKNPDGKIIFLNYPKIKHSHKNMNNQFAGFYISEIAEYYEQPIL